MTVMPALGLGIGPSNCCRCRFRLPSRKDHAHGSRLLSTIMLADLISFLTTGRRFGRDTSEAPLASTDLALFFALALLGSNTQTPILLPLHVEHAVREFALRSGIAESVYRPPSRVPVKADPISTPGRQASGPLRSPAR